MIHLHNAVSLALIYLNRADNLDPIITMEDAENYQNIVNNNLKEMKSKVNILTTPDYEVDPNELFFSYNEGYYTLKKDNLSHERRKHYIMNMPLDVILASQKPNALEAIGLIMIDDKVVKKEKAKTKKLLK